jgi:mono/diheme cytochrome c family protein
MALRKLLGGLVVLGAIGAGAFLFITAPKRLPAETWASAGEPDLANGERIFYAGGCISCHAAPGAADDQKLVLAGGLALKSPFGTFHAPNISPDETAGIGAWTLAEFGDAMMRGTGPDGEHLYPSFPYASYARMTVKDVGDLYAYLKTLPKSTNVAPGHDLPFPFNIRLALGGWKLLYLNDAPRVELASADDTFKRGPRLPGSARRPAIGPSSGHRACRAACGTRRSAPDLRRDTGRA